MVNNNKILTVSYGTFSCTLEGFDDSFGTMKAIAEYFRDLAADDRYFGAEPPQPDADMLASIARRAISRQVEVHEDKGSIVLRAGNLHAAPATTLAPASASEVPDTEVPATAPDTGAREQAPAAPPDAGTAPGAPAGMSGQAPAVSPDAMTQAAAPAGEPAHQAKATTEEATTEKEPVPAPDAIPAWQAGEAGDTPAETPAADRADRDGVIDMAGEWDGTAKAPTTAAQAPEPGPESATRIVPAADSIAAKLQRIRAVVSQNEAASPNSDYTEDEHAEAFVTAAASDLAEALQEDDRQELAARDDELAGDAMASSVLDTLDRAYDETYDEDSGDMDQPSGDVAADIVADLEESVAIDAPAGAGGDANATAAMPAAEPGDGGAGTDGAELFADLDDENMEPADVNEVANILGDDDDVPGDDNAHAGQARPAPRVVKVKRAELDAAIAAGEFEEIGDDIADGETLHDYDREIAGDEDPGALSPEDEDDLMRQLAQVESDPDAATGPGEEPAGGDPVRDEPAANALLMPAQDKAEEDLSRLMAAADEKMEEPETSSRRAAYSQLRAAVVATESERLAGGTIGEEKTDDAYREDLASVVRPRRPTPGPARAGRPPVDDRPAPLKLVAEQRVDETRQTPRGPVRPRRVAATEVEETGPAPSVAADGGFAEYAAQMGAVELPDLLEAAASYLSFVEGRDQFSRPQLMNKVRQAGTKTFNREDGLRSFGQLLRDGKIEKTGGGRFTASREIGFRPDERAAG